MTSRFCAEPLGSNIQTYGVAFTLIEQAAKREIRQTSLTRRRENLDATEENIIKLNKDTEHTEENDSTYLASVGRRSSSSLS